MQTQLAQLKITENLAKAAEHLRNAIGALESGLFVSTADSAESCVVPQIKQSALDNHAVMFAELWDTGLLGYPVIPCGMTQLFRAYSSWAEKLGKDIGTANKFFRSASQNGWKRIQTRLCFPVDHELYRKNCLFVLPPDDRVELQFRKREYQQLAHYLTECYLTFENALQDTK